MTHTLARLLQALFFFAALCPAVVLSQEAPPTPAVADVLKAAMTTMSQPLRFRVVTAGTDLIVYQMPLADGSLASLTEMKSPIKRLTVLKGQMSFDVYLDSGIAIDTRFMYAEARSRVSNISSMFSGGSVPSALKIRSLERNGKEHFEVEAIVASRVIDALTSEIGSRIDIPRTCRYVIEKDTYFVVEVAFLSDSGRTLSMLEFKDIRPQSDLSDDFFAVPPGFAVKRPETFQEYLSIVAELISPDQAVVEPTAQRQPRLRAPPATHLPVSQAALRTRLTQHRTPPSPAAAGSLAVGAPESSRTSVLLAM